MLLSNFVGASSTSKRNTNSTKHTALKCATPRVAHDFKRILAKTGCATRGVAHYLKRQFLNPALATE